MAKSTKKKAAKKNTMREDLQDQMDADVIDDISTAIEDADTDPVIVIPDEPKAARDIVAVGQRFWMVPKGHRRKAREVEVAIATGGGESVTIRCVDNGETRVLPRTAFNTAGPSRVLRA